MIYPVILCGGAGTRLWPLSRKSKPKQFINFGSSQSLFQQTVSRVSGEFFEAPIIVTSDDYRFIVSQQIQDIGLRAEAIILEPQQRSTTASVLVACHQLYNKDNNAVAVFLPSDHFISDDRMFRELIQEKASSTIGQKIVTFGVKPIGPETGFGYIETGEDNNVVAFHEKPTLVDAEKMLRNKSFSWNSGIFLGRVKDFIKEAEQYTEKTVHLTGKALENSSEDLGFVKLCDVTWSKIKSRSIDYEIMENSNNLKCYPLGVEWSDLGDWKSLVEYLSRRGQIVNRQDNKIKGSVVEMDCSNSIIWNENKNGTLAACGLKDSIIISTKDALLAIGKSEIEKLRGLVEKMSDLEVFEALGDTKCYKPWGWYESLIIEEGYQVKKLLVNPGKRLSLQSHEHRSEHWIVTSGTALIQLDEKTIVLETSESIFIKAGQKHRLSNDGSCPLIVTEVQTGSYLGEDDIIRYEDDFARTD